MNTNLFPSECAECVSYIWCSFTDFRVAMILAFIPLIALLIQQIINPRRIISFAGTECEIDWAHYIIIYPIVNLILFIFGIGLTFLLGILLRAIL